MKLRVPKIFRIFSTGGGNIGFSRWPLLSVSQSVTQSLSQSVSTQIKMNVLNKVDISLLGIGIVQPVAMPVYKPICLCYSSFRHFSLKFLAIYLQVLSSIDI